MTQKFKVGDNVRILNVDGIQYGGDYWKNGDVLRVVNVSVAGDPKVACELGDKDGLVITRSEYHCIELVSPKTKKSQRITDAEIAIKAMQYEIAELKFEVAALKQLRNTSTARDFSAEIRADKSPNEKRKAIIAEAKAFVAKYETVRAGEPNKTRKGTPTARNHYYETEFTVKDSKVTAVIYRLNSGVTRQDKSSEIGRSKCAPDDVFNVHIGKAIALGRALGLDVSKFEHAANPTEPRKGTVVRLLSGELHHLETNHKSLPTGFSFVDDTGAQY